MRNQKGVSLITLVITIIVVIILAAIALGGGAADTAGQAQFSGFATEIGGLKESVQTAAVTAKGEEAIRGNNRSFAQLYNYVARGGSNVLTPDASGDAIWLVQADADNIPCTLINKEWAADVLGAKLPVRKVETYKGTNQEVSYYVTPKGQVFCWPPYTYDDKSYITNNVTVTNASGEISGTDATNPTLNATLTATFPETGETVVISNNAPTDTGFERNDGLGTTWATTPSVWYGNASTTTPADRGIAEGLTFEDYDNT